MGLHLFLQRHNHIQSITAAIPSQNSADLAAAQLYSIAAARPTLVTLWAFDRACLCKFRVSSIGNTSQQGNRHTHTHTHIKVSLTSVGPSVLFSQKEKGRQSWTRASFSKHLRLAKVFLFFPCGRRLRSRPQRGVGDGQMINCDQDLVLLRPSAFGPPSTSCLHSHALHTC
jgi:hypothetical protein